MAGVPGGGSGRPDAADQAVWSAVQAALPSLGDLQRAEAVLRDCRGAWPSPGGSGVGALDGSGRGPLLLVGGEGERRTLPAGAAHADLVNWQVGVGEFRRKSRVLAELCEAAGRDPASVRRTHAPNFQLLASSGHGDTRLDRGRRAVALRASGRSLICPLPGTMAVLREGPMSSRVSPSL